MNYGFFGFRFQHRWGGIQGWAYHAGIGLSGISAGMKYFIYKGLYVDLQFGSMLVAKIHPTNTDTTFHGDINFSNTSVAYGFTAMIGGDWFFYRYVGLNAGMGVSYNITNPGYTPAVFAFDFGFFFKFPDKRKKKVVSLD